MKAVGTISLQCTYILQSCMLGNCSSTLQRIIVKFAVDINTMLLETPLEICSRNVLTKRCFSLCWVWECL